MATPRRRSPFGPLASARATKLSRAVVDLTGLTPSGLSLLAVAAVAWLIGYLVAGRPMFLVSYGALIGLAISWLIGRRPLPLTATRSDSRPRMGQGERVEMHVQLSARRGISTFVLEEQIPSALGEPSRLPIAHCEAGDDIAHSYELRCRRRGVFEVGPLVARWGDPFGFTERVQVLTEPAEVIVHPSTEHVHDRPLTRLWEDPPIRPPVSKPWPHGMEFYGMRSYQPGDDVRKIVWRAYARTGELLIRESEQGITDKLTIAIDTDKAGHSDDGEFSESFEFGIQAAASLAVRHLREGYSVTVEANAGRVAGPLRASGAEIGVLDALAGADLGKDPLGDMIDRLVNDPSRDSHIVLITPRLDHATTAKLELLLARGSSVLVAALVWKPEDADTLGKASALGCQVIELLPESSLARAFRRDHGAGQR